MQLRLNGAVHQVAWSDGPERIEREWWHDATDAQRIVTTTGWNWRSGARLWIGRTGALRPDRPARWFLHGYLA